MDSEVQRNRKQFLTNAAYWAVLLAVAYCIFKYLINMVMPFFLALIFAAIARALARFITAKTMKIRIARGKKNNKPYRVKMNKKFITMLSVIIVFLVIIGIFTVIIVRIVNRGISVVEAVPGVYTESIQPGLENLAGKVSSLPEIIDDSFVDMLRDSFTNIIGAIGSKITDVSAKLVVKISSIASKVPSLLLNTIICLIATVFIAMDYEGIEGFFKRNLPEHTLKVAVDFKDSLVDTVWQFLRSYFVIFVITAAEITLGFLIVRQKNALLLGMLIAVFDAFPIVGSGMILLPFSVITMLSARVGKGIGLLIVYLVVVIVRQIIEPKIVGRHVGLSPILTLITMYIGTELFGGIGLFGLPILTAIIIEMNNNGTIHLFKTKEEAEETP